MTLPRVFPKVLPVGATLAVVSPSAPTAVGSQFIEGIEAFSQAGYRLILMPSAQAVHDTLPYLAGNDSQRLSDLHAAFADPQIDGILCARGGYGAMRLLPGLDFDLIARNPKPFIGFSDITVLHQAILQKTGLVTFYGPMLTSNRNEPDSLHALLAMLQQPLSGQVITHQSETQWRCLQPGQAQGRLIGGNLSLLTALCGTPWQPDTRGALLFLEDWHEQDYTLDRQLMQLALAGLLDGIAGLVLCDFSACTSHITGQPVPLEVGDWFARWLSSTSALAADIPIGYGFRVGHGEQTLTLAHGAMAVFCATAGTLTFL